MSRTNPAHTARRLSVATGAVLAAAIVFAAPASAHVEVESASARSLAENVTLDFTAESESDKAGITKLEVILPKGIEAADVTYKEGPKGWKLTATERGYAVSGPAVPVGQDASYSVTVRQLPDAKSLAFKTLQTYSDGRLDRWIELEKPTDGGHGSPAPVLALKAAEPGAKPVSPSPTTEPTTAAPSTPAVTDPTASKAPAKEDNEDAAENKDDGMSPALPIAIGAAVIVLASGLWWYKRRNTQDAS
ncbi:DUF1775 domain-containing protein [Streptomyces sp. NPDC054887]